MKLGLCLTLLLSSGVFANTSEFHKLWFSGTPQEAFAKAKKEKTSMLLYWGAVWCPPCNELKAEIFSKPEFSHLTASLLRVYLDGDSKEAQIWGEKLKASGYPTVLLLSPEGKELFRFSSGVNWAEFKEAMEVAMQAQGSFDDALHQALTQKELAPSVWKLLAYTRWAPEDTSVEDRLRYLEKREALIGKIPARFPAEKALLIAGLFDEVLASEKEPGMKAFGTRLQTRGKGYLEFMLGSNASRMASREALIYNGVSLLEWAQTHLSKSEFSELGKQWNQTMEFLRKSENVSRDLKMWSLYPQYWIAEKEAKKEQMAVFKSLVEQAVQDVDAQAKTAYERHSVISSAASLLAKVGSYPQAEALLEKELKTTDTPWYYQSSMARLMEKQGRKADALLWSQRARDSAKGTTTRLEWMASDLLLNVELAPEQKEKIKALASDYFALARSLPDGLKGRNAKRAKRIETALKPYAN